MLNFHSLLFAVLRVYFIFRAHQRHPLSKVGNLLAIIKLVSAGLKNRNEVCIISKEFESPTKEVQPSAWPRKGPDGEQVSRSVGKQKVSQRFNNWRLVNLLTACGIFGSEQRRVMASRNLV
jgi:hypothetical protein